MAGEAKRKKNTILHPIHTNHPPADALPFELLEEALDNPSRCALGLNNSDTPFEDVLSIGCNNASPEKGIDPLIAIEAFLLFNKNGMFPPLWAMNHICRLFQELHESQGTKSLDQLFGFGRSRGKKFKKKALELRNQELVLELFRLTILFGLSPEEASEMISQKYNLHNPVHPLTDLTVLTIYHRKESKEILTCKFKDFVKNELDKESKKKRIDYLKTFPEGSVPSRLDHFFNK